MRAGTWIFLLKMDVQVPAIHKEIVTIQQPKRAIVYKWKILTKYNKKL